MFAQTVLQACLDLGVRDFCVCAGSRNSDLVHGLLQNRDKIRILPFFEERSAAFFGLGLLQIARTPVAIVTTSGTAVAELLPAVIEAYYQARPLLLITADRPKRYRGSGAPQAIDQSQLFGIYARAFDIESDEDVIDLTTLTQDQPIHLNVCLEEPSAAPPQMSLSVSASTPTDLSVSSTDQALLETFLQQDSPLLVIAGCLNPHEDLINTLLHLKAPILADATSGLHAEPRLHSLLIRGGDQTARRLAFSRVLRIGGVPSFRTWRDLETKPEVEVFSLTQRPFSGLARPSQWIMGDTFPLKRSQQTTPNQWREQEAASAERLEALLDQYPVSEPACLRHLLSIIPSQAQLFVGNSLPIRELSLVAARAMPWPVFSNRGANGIDGNLSTFLGIACGPHARESWGIFGDLTTLYDLAAPAILAEMHEEAPMRIVVINNGGGKIFRRLPHFQGLPPQDTAVVENHHRFDFESWARSWGLDYHCHTDITIDPQSWPTRVVIELRPNATQTEAFWQTWQDSKIS